MKSGSLLGLGLAVCLAGVLAAGTATAQRADNKGVEFVLGFMQNSGSSTNVLFLTGDTATSGTVAIPGLAFSQPFNVTPGAITAVTVPSTASVTPGTQDKGVLVTAQDEIVVYGLNQVAFTTDAFLGLPTDVLGTEYIVLSYTGSTQFMIVATADDTTATITTRVNTGGFIAGVPTPVTLDRLEAFLATGGGDLTGTTISADKPITVFGGGQCLNVPVGISACDHIVEQLPPTSAWGASFLTVPLALRTAGDIFRILASEDGTDVVIDGSVVATLASGTFHEADLASDSFHTITTTGPALVAQYSKGSTADGVPSDPFMMLIPPTEQLQRSYTLTTPPDQPVSFTSFVNVVIRDQDIASCSIDNGAFSAPFTSIGSTGFSGAREPVANGTHSLACSNPFGAYSYGFANFDSYGYPGGLALDPIADEAIKLSPDVAANPLGTNHTVTASLTVSVVDPLPGRLVTFSVGVGPNAGDNGQDTSDANGEATFTYTGDGGIGVDEIVASFENSDEEIVTSLVALKFWDEDCNENGVPDTCDLSCGGFDELCDSAFPSECGLAKDQCLNEQPVDPIVNGPFPLGGWGEGAAVVPGDGNLTVLVAAGSAGLEVQSGPTFDALSLTNTWTPSAGTCPAGFYLDRIVISGDKAYIAAANCGVIVLDVTNPGNPVFERVIAVGWAKSLTVIDESFGTFVVVTDYFDGLFVFEIDGQGVPQQVLSVGAADGLLGFALDVEADDGDGRLLFYVTTTVGIFVVDPGLDPGEPPVIGSYVTNPNQLPPTQIDDVPHSIVVIDGFAYVSIFKGGLLVLNVGIPEQPMLGMEIPTPPAAYGVATDASRTRVFVAAGLCGLRVFEVTAVTGILFGAAFDPIDTTGGGPVPNCEEPGVVNDASGPWAWFVTVVNNVAYVTSGIVQTPSPSIGTLDVVQLPGVVIINCGLGAELALVLPALYWLRSRRSRYRA